MASNPPPASSGGGGPVTVVVSSAAAAGGAAPVATVAAPAGSGAPTTATVLTSAQATQLIQKLRQINSANGGGSGEQQTIKIQAVQTNPSTGVRQIIAIPIQAAAAGQSGGGGGPTQIVTSASLAGLQGKISVSPLKIKQVVSTGGAPPILSGNASNVKVVKLALDSRGDQQQAAATSAVQVSGVATTPSKPSSQLSFGTPSFLDSLSSSGGGRKRADIDFESFSESKRRKSEKGGKGLRHFSMKVCEKVQAKGSTSYNEVADELVAELTDPRCTSPTDQQYDQKNIRRRVYDALNVLMAMNIISKEKKEIRWLGLPTNSVQEANSLEADKEARMDRIRAKTQQLQDLILQQIAFKNLVERNKEREKTEGAPAPNSAIQLPFIIVNTSKKTVIDCSISNDKMEYLFNFDDTFEIHDDMEVLKRMGLGLGLERGRCSAEDLGRARQMVPRALEQYVTQLAAGDRKGASSMPKVGSPQATPGGGGGSNSSRLPVVVSKEEFLPEDSDTDVEIG